MQYTCANLLGSPQTHSGLPQDIPRAPAAFRLPPSPASLPPPPAQIVLAVLGFYSSIFGLYKISSALSSKPKVVPKVVAAAPAASSADLKWGFEPPTLDNFDAWGENAENWRKWEVQPPQRLERTTAKRGRAAAADGWAVRGWQEFMSGPLLDKWADQVE